MSPDYTLLVCPVCLEQTWESFGWEGESANHFHEEWGEVEPLRLKVDLPDFAELREAALLALQPQKAEQAKRKAEREAFEALPETEKERIRAEKRAAMSPMERLLHDSIGAQLKDSRGLLSRTSYGGFTSSPVARKEQ